MPFQHLSWLAPPAASLLQSARGSWVQYCRISLILLVRSDTWRQVTGESQVLNPIALIQNPVSLWSWTHLHLQSGSSSWWWLVLWSSQQATLLLLFMKAWTSCTCFTWSSTCLIHLHQHKNRVKWTQKIPLVINAAMIVTWTIPLDVSIDASFQSVIAPNSSVCLQAVLNC